MADGDFVGFDVAVNASRSFEEISGPGHGTQPNPVTPTRRGLEAGHTS